MVQRRFVSIFLFVTSVVLFGCGGGGDDNANGNGGTQVQATANLDANNGASMASSAISSQSSATAGSALFVASAGSVTPLTFAQRFGGAMLDKGANAQLSTGLLCTTGSISEPAAGASAGTIAFKDCDIGGSGIILNGAITFSATYSSSGFSATLTYQSLTFSDATQTLAVFNGSFNLSMTMSNAGWSYSASTNDFSVTLGNETVSYVNYSHTESFDSGTGDITSAFTYAVTSDSLGGTVIVTTDPAEGGQPVVKNFAEPYPYQGSVVIIGANNDRVRVSADGDGSATGTVKIEYALDGDGVYDDGMDTLSWQEFDDLAAYSFSYF